VAALGFIACQPQAPSDGAAAPAAAAGPVESAPAATSAPVSARMAGPDLASLEMRGLVPKEADDTCGARALANIVDRPADMPGLPEASAAVRYLNPDSMATMDFRPDRLNIDVNAEGRIWKLRCG
jgi:hypothetical protein